MGSKALYLSPAIGRVSVFTCEGEVYAPDEGSVVSAGGPGQGMPLIVYGPSIAWVVGGGRAGAFGKRRWRLSLEPWGVWAALWDGLGR